MNSARQEETRGPKGRLFGPWVAIVTLGLTVLVSAACGGGGDQVAPGSTTAQPTVQGSAIAQPTGQATTSATCQALASLQKYRYTAKATVESPEELAAVPQDQPTPMPTVTRPFQGRFSFEYNVDASVVMPDSIEASTDTGGGTPLDIIIIGDRNWVSLQGQWHEGAAGYGVGYRPLDICNGLFPELHLDQAQAEEETVNNVPARHYTFSAIPSGQAMGTIFGPGSDMDLLLRNMNVEVWLADKDGFPIRMDVQASGVYIDGRQLLAHIRIELRDINSKDIRVEPPI